MGDNRYNKKYNNNKSDKQIKQADDAGGTRNAFGWLKKKKKDEG